MNTITLRLAGILCLMLVLSACGVNDQQQASINSRDTTFTRFVNPYIGSAMHGHVFVGANVPFGAVQAGPDNIFEGWDWCSGYNYSSNTITGFAQTHLSGTGIGDMGDLRLMPSNGKVWLTPGTKEHPDQGYLSFFSHNNEIVKPGYYSVLLDKHGIRTEITASERVALYRITFSRTDSAHIMLDLENGIGWDRSVKNYIRQTAPDMLVGYRYSTGWAKDQRVFFAIQFSQPIKALELYDSATAVENGYENSKQLKAVVHCTPNERKTLLVKIGLSPVSTDNALKNIHTEVPGWNFDTVAQKADEKWNCELSKVAISADSITKTTFYTALYHTMMAPSLFNDSDGDYRGTDKEVYHNAGFTNYTTFSLWDTYRAYHPLFTILHPDRVPDIINTFLAIYRQQGKLPVWHLAGNETNTMIGYHAVPVIVDAYLKGFRDFDTALAYKAIKESAMQRTDGIQFIQRLQYIPADSVNESVAKGLEYAIDDWCIARMAKAMNRMDDYKYFLKRGQLYALYFDKQTRFMRGRLANGTWRTPFDPFTSKHREDDYTEGNAWQYTWLVPQHVEGLISLMGGDAAFAGKLDSLFMLNRSMGEDASPDISGLIGQYAQGNEPNHHIPYLYSYAGMPGKTAALVRKITDTFYTAKPDGLCGNEDVGQMSSWYVFTALGFYPVNPVNGMYVFGSPLVDEAAVTIADKTFHLKVINNSKKNKYIQRATFNGQPYTKTYLLHKDIVRGGELVLYMGSEPSAEWGIRQEDRPFSMIPE